MTRRQTSGFTLVEILAVVVIVAVLASIAVPRLHSLWFTQGLPRPEHYIMM